jgi:cobalt-zinc-cadmium efflux system membrane fusion protein
LKKKDMNIPLRSIVTLAPVLFLLPLSACRNPSGGGEAEAGESLPGTALEVVITREQYETAGMRTGAPSPFEFLQTTSAHGHIMASPSGQVRVSTLIPGQVKKLPVNTGDYVRKGQVLFTLEGREILLLQQEYASASHELTSVRANYERQKALSEEEFTSRKALAEAESAYMSLVSKVEGLRAQMELVHLDPIDAGEGTFFSEIPVLAPINGYITHTGLVLGQFIEPSETVLEIVDTDQLQLQLHLFEVDLTGLAAGQQVFFYAPDNPGKIYEGRLTRLGQSIDPETKTVLCLAELRPGDRSAFVHGQFVEASIITGRREALAIPDQALINEEGKYYVLALASEAGDSLGFRRAQVQVGVIQQDHAEILDEGLEGILLEGVFNLTLTE